MKEIKRPLDSFFNRLISDEDVVREFPKSFLPEELKRAVDYNSARIGDSGKTISMGAVSKERHEKEGELFVCNPQEYFGEVLNKLVNLDIQR